MSKNPAESGIPDSPLSAPAAPRHHWASWRRLLAVSAFGLFAVPRVFWRVLLISYFVLAIVFLMLRYIAAPQIAAHREDITAALSHALGLKVEVATLQADWNGLRPALHLSGFKLFDHEGRLALELPKVDAAVAWSSLWRWQLDLYQLRISKPELTMRREANGAIFVAGVQVNDVSNPDSHFSDFILRQHQIVVSDARITWRDELRNAPPLQLDHMSLQLNNSGSSHRFALVANPPAAYAAKLDLRGDLRGAHLTHLDDWHGTLYLAMDRADLAVWQHWVSYPVELPQGKGGLRAWLNFEGPQLAAVTTDVALRDVQVRFAPDLPMLALTTLSGRIGMARRATPTEKEFSVLTERLQLTTRDGLQLAPASFALRSVAAEQKTPAHGEVSGEHLDMNVLSQLASYLPMPNAWRQWLGEAEPRGRVTKLAATWQAAAPTAQAKNSGDQSIALSAASAPAQFKIDADVDALAMRPRDNLPGFDGLSGSVHGTQREGQVDLHIHQGGLYLPSAMATPHILLDQMDVLANWSHGSASGSNGKGGEQLHVQLKQLAVSNADVSAELNGNWRGKTGPGASLGYVDLSGSIKRANVAATWRYLPLVLNEGTRHYLEEALRGGVLDNGHIRVAGDMTHFPFRDSSASNADKGAFKIDGHFHDTEMEFAPRWPAMTGLTGELLFEGSRMLIRGESGYYGAVQVSNVKVEIPDLIDAGRQVLTVNGHARGPTKDFLSYVSASPLDETSNHLTDDMQAQGNGDLDLQLLVPLHDSIHTQVKAGYGFANNQVRLLPTLPEFGNATGKLAFTEHGVTVPELTADFIGSHMHAKGIADADGSLRIDFGGTVPAKGLSQLVNSPVWSHLAGETPASATLRLHQHKIDLVVESSLLGLTSNLPAPFAKTATEPLPFIFGWQFVGQAPVPAGIAVVAEAAPTVDASRNSTQNWHVQIGKRGDAQWQDHCDVKGCQFQRGALAVNDVISMPEHGMRMSGRFDKLDIDAWKPVISAAVDAAPVNDNDNGMAISVAVQAGEMLAVGQSFHNVVAHASRQDQGWQMHLEGPDIAGDLTWLGAGQGRMRARLTQLALQPVKSDSTQLVEADPRSSLPALDVVADKFSVQGMALGRLELQATNQGEEWRLDHFAVESPDGKLVGDGLWRPFGSNRATSLNLALDTPNVGALLTRLNYPNSVRSGTASLKGTVAWSGTPTSIDYPTLSGDIAVTAAKGQFNKLDPGAGRLLGILSLQALPRRMTLDFHDVFSEGFAFDAISGNTRIANGVMSTQDLEIRGPAAKVFMTGSTDLAHETHNLHVTVQPTLSESVAIGAAVVGTINPLVGLATYLAQKALRDPVEKMFGYEYTITGSWADPKVDKLGGPMSFGGQSEAPATPATAPTPQP